MLKSVGVVGGTLNGCDKDFTGVTCKHVTVTLTFDLWTSKSIGFLGSMIGSYTPNYMSLG